LACSASSARSTRGGWSGWLSGLGAATADAIYGAIAAFGLSLIAGFLVEQQMWLGLAGGLFLCYLGVRTVTAAPAEQAAAAAGEPRSARRLWARRWR
jgi:threonine/homoserine/homoserine lactone efflux protein